MKKSINFFKSIHKFLFSGNILLYYREKEVGTLNLKVYQIITSPEQHNEWVKLVDYLSKLGFLPGEHNLRYCLNREYIFEKEKGIYVAAIHEEYIPDQTEITEEQAEKPIENIDPWERTIFAIDFTHKKLLIQQRDYSPRNLSRPRTRTRITSLLDEAWSEVLNMEFNYIPTNLNLGNDYFINNFVKGHKVLGAKLSFNKSWLVKDIFDDEEMLEEWKDAWNHDESKISELTFKTKADGDLHNSPFFKLALSSSGVLVESITYYDSTVDKPRTESRSQFDQIEVEEVTKRTEITIALNETCRSIEANKQKLKDLRAISFE